MHNVQTGMHEQKNLQEQTRHWIYPTQRFTETFTWPKQQNIVLLFLHVWNSVFYIGVVSLDFEILDLFYSLEFLPSCFQLLLHLSPNPLICSSLCFANVSLNSASLSFHLVHGLCFPARMRWFLRVSLYYWFNTFCCLVSFCLEFMLINKLSLFWTLSSSESVCTLGLKKTQSLAINIQLGSFM